MAQVVFNNPEKLKKLNSIVHPAVGKDFEEWTARQKTNLVFKEAAILFETGIYRTLDAVILVTAPLQIRIERVMQRDSASQQEVKNRMKNQWTDEKKKKLAQFTIDNSGKIMVIPQVSNIISEIKKT